MEQELGRLTEQDLLERIKQLEPQHIAEIVDFIEFLAEKKRQGVPLVRVLEEKAGPRVGLAEVRRRLAKIVGKMSDTVRELRDERG